MAYKSNTVDIVRISTESELYEIFANTNDISKYMEGTVEDYTLSFSPLELTVQFYDRKIQQLVENIDYKFNVYLDNNWISFSIEDLQNSYTELNLEQPFSSFFTITGEQLIFKVQEFYNYLNPLNFENEDINYILILKDLLLQNSSILKIQWFIDSQLITEGIIVINFGLLEDAARFNINANSINASIDNGFLEFTSSGLQLHNGGLIMTVDGEDGTEEIVFSIQENLIDPQEYNIQETDNPQELGLYEFHSNYSLYNKSEEDTNPQELGLYELVNKEYILTNDTSFLEGKNYYRLVEEYVLTTDTTPQLGKTYYIIDTSHSLYLNGTGTFNGDIYANSGYFHGTVEAESGYFIGELRGATGSFSGRISAAAGDIGGFNITSTELRSKAATYSIYETSNEDNPKSLNLYEIVNGYVLYTRQETDTNPQELGLYELNNGEYSLTTDTTFIEDKEYYLYTQTYILTEDETPVEGKTYFKYNPSIILNGINGNIIANNITLGTGAIIRDYISLGGAYLYNPDLHNGLILQAGDVSLSETGDLILGDLSYNSLEQRLQGNNWWIGPDKAVFNNIDVMGTIHSSVFETGKIQAVGGGIIFSPASKFEIGENNNIILNSNISLNDDDLVLLTSENSNPASPQLAVVKRVIETIGDSEVTSIFFRKVEDTTQNIDNLSLYDTVTFLNNNGEELLIGVNSTDSNNNFLYPQGFSFIQPQLGSNTEYYTEYGKPILFLGNLNSLDEPNIGGFGLYGDNVYLKGSLTTKSNTGTYAGVNTINGVPFNPPNEQAQSFNDKSNIVFWAGANDNTVIGIQNANFQVTEKGTIYAQQGYFADSVIVNSQIGASKLNSPAIYGSGVLPDPSLILTDVAVARGGISLRTFIGENNTEEVFNLNENSFKYKDIDFIQFSTFNDTSNIDFYGRTINLDSLLKLHNFRIAYNNNQYSISQVHETSENEILNSIIYTENALELTHAAAAAANSTRILIENQIITLDSQDIFIPSNLSIGDKVDIIKVDGGFNINIQE